MIIGDTHRVQKQIFGFMNWTFVGFGTLFDGNKRSLLFDWEDGMTKPYF